MSNHPKKKGRRKAPFVQIQKWEMGTPAFRALMPNEIVVYLWMRSLYNGTNNGRIHMSTREAATLIHKSNSSGKRALDRLITLGFIKVRQGSTFDQKRMAREFELTAIDLKEAHKASVLPKGTCDFARFKSLKEVAAHERNIMGEKTKRSVTHGKHSAAPDVLKAKIGVAA